jgi:LuxR family maltose regulon positive regulatory protein
VVESSAPLCISRAWVAALAGLDGEMERWLQRAASLPSPEPLPDGSASAAGQVALIRGLNCGQDLGRGLAQVRRAAELERQGSPWWPLVQLMLGLWGYLEHGAGEDVLEALRAADATAFSTGQAQSAAIAPALIAVVLLECGDRDGAEAMARRAGRMRDLLGIRRVAQTAYSWWGTSVVHLGCGRLEEAAQDALMGVTLTADIAPGLDTLFFRPPSRIQLARVRLAQGDRPAARTLLREVRDQLARAPDAGLMMRWLEETETAAGIRARTGDGADELSERELTVLRMLSGSANLGEIASQLFVSRNTVKSHTKAIYAKLGVTSRHDAVSRARELRLT